MMNQTQKHTTGKKFLALLLALVMMLSLLPTSVLATGSDPTVVIAGSDFQAKGGHTAGAQTVTSILTNMQNDGYAEADGFLFCGDYDYDTVDSTSSTEAGITALKNAVTGTYSTLANDRMVLVEGNHDAAAASGLATSGAHDTAEYGVFVINEDDYMWNNSNEATIITTAANLKKYLDTKAAEGFDKPIFVLSHLPLHYSMRTKNYGDGMYANYIFDVLNAAGANGLNIIFLYGHDHSNGWDDYLGGSCVYLAKGKNINIAQGSKTEFNVETLNFTYMNAGFTGYYEKRNSADDTLTMTAFQIYSDRVVVSRYSAAGVHNLKCKGVTNSYKNESGYAPDGTVVTSPQTITLTAVEDVPALTIDGAPVSSYKVDRAKKQTLTFTPINFTATSWASSDETVATVEDGVVTLLKAGKVTITATGTPAARAAGDTTSASVTLTVTDSGAEPTERTYTLVTSTDQLVDGQYLLIYNTDTDKFMLPEVVTKSNSSSSRVGFNVGDTNIAGPDTITGDYSAKEWTFTKDGDGWKIGTTSGNITFTNTSKTGITATLESSGNTFTISGSADSFTFQSGSYYLNYNSRGLINGYESNPAPFYIYRLTSTGTVDPSGGDWVTIPDGQGKTIFRLVNQLTAGKKYLIVSSNQAGSANAVNLNGTSINSASVTIIADGGDKYIEAPANTAQWTYTNADKFQNVSNTGRYLRGGKNAGDSLKTTKDSDDSRTTWRYNANNGLYETSDNRYIGSSFKMLSSGSSSNRVYIYEEATLQASAEYAKLTGSLTYTVTPGTSAEDALAAVKAGIDVVTSSDKTNETTLPDDNNSIKWTLDSSYQGEAGEYAVTISYKNKVLGTAKVIVPALTVTNIAVTPMEGTVQKGASNYAKTGSTLTVTYSDNSTRKVYVTLGMLSGNFNKNAVGDYTGLTVTYGGKTVTGYTLHVTPKSGNDYPEYPHEGAVRVGKTGEGIDFQSSGIAKVELTATGVPVKKGADVIVMVDTSSSMTTTVSGSNNSRIEVLRESLTNLIRQFQAVGADGEPQDIRVAIADFNGYVTSGEDNTPYRLKSVDHLKGTTTRTGTNAAKVYTGSTQLNAGAFVTAEQAASVINSINTSSGTNYDYAFDATYQLGQAILKQNAQDGEDRDLFVIFMSDGAPFQYNYFSSQSEAANWNNWLQGTVTDNMRDSGAHNYFYNGSGNKHRMAEAIKGDPNEKYTVIRKDSTDNYGGQQYMTQLPGLGATMYSIGFCLEQDNQITIASMEYVLKNISSDPTKFYYKVNTADELSSAFTAIGNEIAYAATNARFVDTMGDNYDLRMASSTYTLSDGTTDTITPEITVQAYDIYTAADGVAESEIGKRKGTSTVLETVTFNGDGTEAYSDKKSGNILIDGVICANTFWYNTTGNTVSIDTDGDGTNDYNLAPETFYWKMGTINQTELALSYYVYLTGSMEGTREAGSYPTNESATLYYTNWLGNEAKKDTVSPVLAWKSANVSYAFYLVNENGEIIVNKATGQTGSFANKVAVTNPVVYSEVLLNSAENVQADILASGVLPEGYALYDTEAAYNVRINSNSTGGWTITKGTVPATTYVTEYGGVPTTVLSTEDASYDYTHTVVWFAVKYTVKAIPDAVVVDYGLPVDIHVLKNDMFYDKGVLMYVGAEKTDGAVTGDANAAFTTTEFEGTYGTATVMANASVPEDIVVRYTPANMQMNSVDKFSYAVHYTGTENSGYYYGTVTVIPAANIYYEDSFVKTSNSSAADETYGVWTTDGTTDSKTQAEDRPGTASVLDDANNLYGYDAAYANFKQFSLGSAKKVTVNAATGTPNTAPTASFTFTGTGFDIISLTDNTSGTIVVTVKNRATNVTKNYSVNNYFGYTYSDGTWTPTNSANPNALYQVPVIKVENLAYGTYDVTIKVAYLKSLDQHDTGKCSFWLDAVRIYDPARDDETAKKAYSADKESSPDYAEVRNLLIDGNKFAVNNDAGVTGAVFIDGIASDATIQQFTEFGPNNEAYLAADQAIAFQLVANRVPESVQLGAKLAAGNSATLYFNGKEFKTLSTATDMYYALSGLNWTKDETNSIYTSDVVVLQHKGGDGIISLTNIKITGGAEFIETSADPLNEVKLAKEPVVMALASPQMAARALKMVAVYEEPAPEILSVVADSAEVMVGDTVKLTVTTNADTDYILVNAAAVETYTEDEAGNRVWTYEAKAEEPGEVSFTVTAMSADGHESEESTCTVDVQQPAKPANDIAAMVKKAMNAFRKIFDAIFGWRR